MSQRRSGVIAMDGLWQVLAIIGLLAEEMGMGRLFWRVIEWMDGKQRHGMPFGKADEVQHDKKGSHAR